MDFGVITFASTHTAIRTQKHLERHMKVTMMPTLREISQGCGISLRFALTELANVQRRMADFDLDPKMFTIYRIRMVQGKYQAEQVDALRRES